MFIICRLILLYIEPSVIKLEIQFLPTVYPDGGQVRPVLVRVYRCLVMMVIMSRPEMNGAEEICS